jgi:hypothetical protein
MSTNTSFKSRENKRHFHRVGHDAHVTLSLAGLAYGGTLEDISLQGCLLRLDEEMTLDRNRPYHLSVQLTYAIKIQMEAMVSHQDGLKVGFRCISIDTDSVANLKRLVELNLGDSSLLERDMQALLRG